MTVPAPYKDVIKNKDIERSRNTDSISDNKTYEKDTSYLAAKAARAYGKNSKKSADELVVDYIPLVHRIVSQVASYLKPPLTKEDLVSAGCVGLVKAANNFDPFKDADFKTYAYIRVRGAVIDELRSWSFTPTGTNKKLKELAQIYQQLEEDLGHLPTDKQIADCMSITIDELYKLYEKSRCHNFLSLQKQGDDGVGLGDMISNKREDAPNSRLDKQELAAKLTEAILNLPERHKQVVVLYYQQELTMKEVAEVLEITESRVSQIHASAIFKLQSKLKIFCDYEQ